MKKYDDTHQKAYETYELVVENSANSKHVYSCFLPEENIDFNYGASWVYLNGHFQWILGSSVVFNSIVFASSSIKS